MNTCAILGTSYFSSKENAKINKNMEEIGFDKIKYFTSKHLYFRKWAGTPKERMKLFYKAWNSDTDAIFALKGGSGVSHFINMLDPNSLQGKKLFVGYSDLTMILNFLHEKKGIVSLHGPMSTASLDYMSSFYLKKALSMEGYSLDFSSDDISNKKNNLKKIEGGLVGGNLTRLLETLHYFDIDFREKIVFIEEVGEDEAKILNDLFILSSYKYFQPKAVIFGNMGTKFSAGFDTEIKKLLKKTPLIFNLPFGHALPNITMPLGANGEIDFIQNKLCIDFPDSQKDYAIKFEGEIPSTPESFKYFFKEMNKKRRLFNIPKKQKPAEEILERYSPENMINAKRLYTEEKIDAVNLSNKIKIGKETYFFVEEYKKRSNLSKLFLKKKNELISASPWEYHIKKPRSAKINDSYIVGGETKKGYSLYKMIDVGILKNICSFSKDVKDILLKKNKERIDVFVKYKDELRWLRINSLKELNEDKIFKSQKVSKFSKKNSFNLSQLLILKNGLIGIMGSLTRYLEKGGHYFSYPFAMSFDPLEKRVSSTRIIIKRSELPEIGSLFANTYNLVSPASIIRGKTKSFLYVTVGGSYVYRLVIKDPFEYYEKKF